MMRCVLIIFALAAQAETVISTRYVVQIAEDGITTFPSNSIATPAQVSGVEAAAADAKGIAEAAAAQAQACADKVALFSTNYVVTSTVYVQSVGAVAYDASNQTIRVHNISVTDTNVMILATVKQLPLVTPTIDWRQTAGAGGAWSSVVATAVSSTIPEGVTDAAAAYLFSIVRPVGATSSFFRVVDNSTGASGSGLYWVVFGGLVVDGHKGSSGIITNVVGSVTNTYRKVGGIIVEPEPLGGF
jgi:hypothetical protein